MLKRLVFCIIFTLFFANTSLAENKLESWYTYWGIGYSNVSYPSEMDEFMDDIKDLPGVTQTSISLDILGFYWPLGEKTILGFIINGWGDRYQISSLVDDEFLQMNGYLYSCSCMHYLNNRIGKGLFLRADIGPARLGVTSTGVEDVNSDWGYGALLGGGFGIPVSQGTRILINANYSLRIIENDTYGALQISLGGLF